MVRVGRYIFSEQKETLTLFPENEKKEKKNICIRIIMLAYASLMTATCFFVKFKERFVRKMKHSEIKTAALFLG
jgi:hypothetical protein